MGNTHKNTEKRNNARYILINGQKVYLTKSQQQAWDEENGRVRRLARKEGRCGTDNYSLCAYYLSRGLCDECPHQLQGIITSISDAETDDEYGFGEFHLIDHSPSPEETVLREMMLDELYRTAGLRERNGDQILRLYLEEGLSSYKIADRIGMRQTTVNDELNRLLAYIREHRDDILGL